MDNNTKIYKSALVILYSVIVLGTIVRKVDWYFAITFMLWVFLFFYYLANWKNNIVILCYLFTFFTFLLAREAFYRYTFSEKYYLLMDKEANYHTCFVILLSLIFVAGSYELFEKNKFVIRNLFQRQRSEEYMNGLQHSSKIVFYCTYIFYLINILFRINYIQQVGYLASYTAEATGPGTPWIIEKLALFCPVALFCFLATFPSKKECGIPLALYALYGFLTLLTGQRYPVIAVTMLIVIYTVIRDRAEGGWITRTHYFMLMVGIPIAAVGLLAVDSIRLGNSFETNSFLQRFIEFFAVQGGSINVIKYGKFFEKQLQDIQFYSINSILSNILNLNPYHNNSLEYAMYGHSFAARMSVLEYGKEAYLAGHGVGSSFIAEMYHDFGYIGVGVGSFIYGWCISKINQLPPKKPICATFCLMMISPLLFAPRGEFDGFIGQTFRRGNIIALVAILIFSIFFRKRNNIENLCEEGKLKNDFSNCPRI